jgi:hypothetical protein
MSKKYKIGDVSFGCLEDKQIWILKGVIHSLDYIGRETEISNTENELRVLSIKQLNQVIKSIEKSKQLNDKRK